MVSVALAAQHRARLHQQLTEFYLPSAGVDLSVYGWGTDGESARNHLAAAEHKTVLYGSWYSFMHPGADVFQQFLATHG